MKELIKNKKQVIMVILVIAIMVLIAVISTNFKGDTIPFEINSIYVTSSGSGKYVDENNTENWNLNLLQNNDIFINFNSTESIQKINKKDGRIKEIYIENFKFENGPFLGNTINLYKLSNNQDKLFEYEDAYKFENKLAYTVVDENANEYNLEVNKTGGQIALSIVNNNVKELEIKDEEEVYFDGTLLKRADIKQDELTFTASFDIVLITEKNNKYISNIKLDLPCGNVIEEGFSLNKDIDVTNMQFKNIK